MIKITKLFTVMMVSVSILTGCSSPQVVSGPGTTTSLDEVSTTAPCDSPTYSPGLGYELEMSVFYSADLFDKTGLQNPDLGPDVTMQLICDVFHKAQEGTTDALILLAADDSHLGDLVVYFVVQDDIQSLANAYSEEVSISRNLQNEMGYEYPGMPEGWTYTPHSYSGDFCPPSITSFSDKIPAPQRDQESASGRIGTDPGSCVWGELQSSYGRSGPLETALDQGVLKTLYGEGTLKEEADGYVISLALSNSGTVSTSKYEYPVKEYSDFSR